MGIEHSIIQQARQTDLASYLIARGEPLIKNGKGYSHKVHDSLKIIRNCYCWNSKGTEGNSINFMMDFYNMTFLQAVEELTGESSQQVTPYTVQPPAQRVLEMPEKADNVRRVIAYLLQTRKISKPVLQLCFDRHLVYQDTNGNVVFRMTDIAGEVVGAERVGTSQKRFKGIAGGSKANYGFNITLGEEKPAKMGVFESSIDLLSYITLYGDNLTNHVLVSMEGLKEQTLLNMAEIYNIPLSNVWCLVDRDAAGIQFADEMKVKHGTKTYLPPVKLNVKDWNEILTR